MSKSKIVKSRPIRRSVARRGPLYFPEELKEPGYHYRFLNDVGNQLQNGILDGYSPVTLEDIKSYVEKHGKGALPDGLTVKGDRIVKHAGIMEGAKPYDAVICRIPIQRFEELSQEKNERDDETDRSLRGNVTFGDEL